MMRTGNLALSRTSALAINTESLEQLWLGSMRKLVAPTGARALPSPISHVEPDKLRRWLEISWQVLVVRLVL